ncbi:MAG: hypothetical protein M0Q13_04465 [Methanothrix sp.]|nr:hypothetical protein [Methanothrix sp.]
MFVPGWKCLMWILLLASIILMVSPAKSAIYPFGSKVLSNDSDIGRPLFPLPVETTVAFWDIGTPGYDEEDPVYLHIGPSASGTTNANDVRLTFFANVSPGSKVTFLDSDMNRPIKQLPSVISFLDIHGSRAYDLNDPVYLHHIDRIDHSEHPDLDCYDDSENSADMMTGFSERLPYRGREISSPGLGIALFTDNYKLFISDKILDKKPRKIGEMRGLCIEMVRGLKADYYHVLGTWLIKIQPCQMVAEGSSRDDESAGCRWEDSSALLIQTNDIRLSSMGNLTAGTKVTNFDDDQNKLVAWPPFASFLGPDTDTNSVGYFDVNGNGIYDYEDDVYMNVPAGMSKGIVTVNNVRLSGPI